MENAAKNKKKRKALGDLDFDELISKFIAKDSMSNIQQSSLMGSSCQFDTTELKKPSP